MNDERIKKLPKWTQEKWALKTQANDELAGQLERLERELEIAEEKAATAMENRRIADLDKRILRQVNDAMGEAITKELTGYNKPLSKITERVIADHEVEIYQLVNTEVVALLTANEFKAALKKALNDKLARVLIARTGGEIERRVNELKANPETRAKITLAIGKVIDELAVDRSA